MIHICDRGTNRNTEKVKTLLLKFLNCRQTWHTFKRYINVEIWNFHTFSHFCVLGMVQACDANKKKVDNISKALDKMKCCSQSHVWLAVWELISLNPRLHPCQLAGLWKMTHFLTVPCQWRCLSEIPSHVCSHAKVISIILFLTNSSQPSLNLIGLWSYSKTKAANLSVRAFERRLPSNASQVFWACVQRSLKNMTATF